MPAEQISTLGGTLPIRDAGWVKHEGPHGVAFFPETARDEQDWEQRAIAQSQAAERDTIILEPKPLENVFARGRAVRGD